jgi:hypothetical protein
MMLVEAMELARLLSVYRNKVDVDAYQLLIRDALEFCRRNGADVNAATFEDAARLFRPCVGHHG